MRREALVLMITSASAPSSCVLVFDVDIFFLDTALGSGNSQKRRSPTCLKSQKLHFFVRKNKRPIDNPQPKNKSQFWNYEIPVNHKPRSRRSFFQCFFFLIGSFYQCWNHRRLPPKAFKYRNLCGTSFYIGERVSRSNILFLLRRCCYLKSSVSSWLKNWLLENRSFCNDRRENRDTILPTSES